MKVTHTGIYIIQRTWRDGYWTLLGMILMHPWLFTKSMCLCAWLKWTRSDTDVVRFIDIEKAP